MWATEDQENGGVKCGTKRLLLLNLPSMKQIKKCSHLNRHCVVQQILNEGTMLEINIALVHFFNIFPTVRKLKSVP